MKEVWRDICFEEHGTLYDYTGLYQISNLGRVKSLNYRRSGKEQILKLRKDKDNYLRIILSKSGEQKSFQIHRLVAYMFLPISERKVEVDHLDRNRENNSVGNLRWVTRKENNANRTGCYNNRTEHYNVGSTNGRARQVEQYDMNMNLIKVWDCAKDVTDHYGFNYKTFHKHLNGTCSPKYKNYIWQYVD